MWTNSRSLASPQSVRCCTTTLEAAREVTATLDTLDEATAGGDPQQIRSRQ